ncbi:MAG: hypothetical protein HZB55_16710 [Deltaproteobacteria bacterium]|nr:hypothetical protein [Deltaproteobacteria bacterium]
MGSPRSRVLRRLLVPFAGGLGLAVAVSLGLDRSAERARQLERVRLWAQVSAQVAAHDADGSTRPGHDGGGSGAGVAALLQAVVRTDRVVSAVRVERPDGRVLGSAGAWSDAEGWEDRTFALPSGPVRVRLGYRLGAPPLGLVVRAAVWATLVGAVLAAVWVTVWWSLRE